MFHLKNGASSISVNVITDEGGFVSVAAYFTENTTATEEEAVRRTDSLGQRAIDKME